MVEWKKKKALFFALATPGAFWITAFFLIPITFLWLYSLGEKTSITEVDINGTPENYLRAFEPIYLFVMWKSIWIAALVTALCLIIAYPVALLIAFAPKKWKPILLIAVILPFWVNLLIRTYALIAVFRYRGYINFVLEWMWEKINGIIILIGLNPQNIIGEKFYPLQMLYNDFSVIAGLVYVYIPFMILPLYAVFERLDTKYIEASLDLGAGQWKTFRKITVPLTMPGIISGIILVFVPCLGTFLTPDLLGGNKCNHDRKCHRATI